MHLQSEGQVIGAGISEPFIHRKLSSLAIIFGATDGPCWRKQFFPLFTGRRTSGHYHFGYDS